MTPRRVLLIMDDCGAGDALRLTGHVSAVRRAFPDARIRMVASAGAASVYRRSSGLDRVIESRLYRRRSRGWRGRARKSAEVLRLAVAAGLDNDLVITFWWGSRVLSALARLCGRRRIVGYGMAGADPYDFAGDEMEQNRRLLEAAGVDSVPQELLPAMDVDGGVRGNVRRLLARSGWNGASPLVVLHTGSDWACQQWSPLGWAAVGDAMASEAGAHVVFTGSRSEKDYVRRIRASMRQRSASVAGETSLEELAGVIEAAHLVVTVDSAAFVVASSQAAPTVVLAGPSKPERLVAGRDHVRIVKRMTPATEAAVNACKKPRFPDGGCHEYSCPLAGLQELDLDEVLGAIRATGALEPKRAAV